MKRSKQDMTCSPPPLATQLGPSFGAMKNAHRPSERRWEPTSWTHKPKLQKQKTESNAVKQFHNNTHYIHKINSQGFIITLWVCDIVTWSAHRYKLYHTCVDGHVVLARLAVCRDRLPSANWLQFSFTSTGVQKFGFSTKQKIRTGRCIFSRMKAMRNAGLRDFSSTHP